MTVAGPLGDLRVLDLGHVIAGPFAATLLADLGADVIKIEHPAHGDAIRALSPVHDGVPLWWKVAERNKRSMTLDLRHPAGRDLLLQLVRMSDVLIENFRPGTLERWRLAPETLWAENEQLVILRISGHGQGEARPGFGRIGEAMSGAVHLTGEPDGRPLHVGFSLGDATSGLLGAFGVLAAIHASKVTGRGDVVDIALFESLLRMIEWQLPMAEKLGKVVQRAGNAFPIGYAVGGSYATADRRWLAVSAATEAAITNVLEIVGGSALADDPRFKNFTSRSVPGRLTQIDRHLEAWIGERSATEVLRTFAECDVAAGLVYDAQMILGDPWYAERGAVVEVEDPELGSMHMPGVMPKLRRNPGAVRWAGARLGEHNDEILGELLGLPREEIERLAEDGVIGSTIAGGENPVRAEHSEPG